MTLYHSNHDANAINVHLKSTIKDLIAVYRNNTEMATSRRKLQKMSIVETGSRGHFPSNWHTSISPLYDHNNINVADVLVKGSIGVQMYVKIVREDCDAGANTKRTSITECETELHFNHSNIGQTASKIQTTCHV